jgi:hypothetical protein
MLNPNSSLVAIGDCTECGCEVGFYDDAHELEGKLYHDECLPICETCCRPVFDGAPFVRVDYGPQVGFFDLIGFNGQLIASRPQRDGTFAGVYHAQHFIEAFFPPEEAA